MTLPGSIWRRVLTRQVPPARLPESNPPAPHRMCGLVPLGAPDHKLNADQTVAVATDVFWNEDMSTCPRGAKVQLLGAGGVAVYGDYHGDPFWQAWAPLPKRRRPKPC
jgi:hypothetical protein